VGKKGGKGGDKDGPFAARKRREEAPFAWDQKEKDANS